MTAGHTTGLYNIIASLQAWLAAELATRTPPLLSTAPSVLVDWPEKALTPPCYSLTFLGAFSDAAPYQGNRISRTETGRLMHGVLEVSCWVTRNNTAWAAVLMQMTDAVTECVSEALQVGSIPVKDFYTSASAPANAAYRIWIDGMEPWQMPPTDPNPDLERRRCTINVRWVERVTNV